MENERRLRVVAGGDEGRDDGALPVRFGAAEASKLLRGIKPRPGRPPVECEECGDAGGWVLAADGGYRRCPRCAEAERTSRLDRVMEAAGVPRRYRRASLIEYLRYHAESDTDPEYAVVERHVEEWREASAVGETPDQGLYVEGGGRAATSLVCALMREAATVARFRAPGEDDGEAAAVDALYVSAPLLLDEMRSSRDAGADPVAAMRRVSLPSLLVVDALPERAEPAARTRLAAALKIRDDEARPTVVVSRLSVAGFAAAYGDDAGDIVREGYEHVRMPLLNSDAGGRA
ncbi:MAG: hypothetical protein M3Q49_11210 [Actinomycetota bacterium]|nr:hypothetical protein [Actinomycetota bacterium]